MKTLFNQLATPLVALCTMSTAFAHSGGTDANGCHAGTQPYHCHGGSSSGSGSNSGDKSGLSFNEAAKIIAGGLALVSGFYGFNQPILLAYDGEYEEFGAGAAYIGKQVPLYLSSKFFSDSSTINFGTIRTLESVDRTNILLGVGAYSECNPSICGNSYTDETGKLNFNIGLQRHFNNASLLIDIDTANSGVSIGLSSR